MKTLLKRQVLANLDYDAQVTDKKEIISTPNMQQSPEKILKLWWNVVIDVRFQDHEFGLCLLMVFLSQVFGPMAHVSISSLLAMTTCEQKSYEIPHQISLVMIKMGLHSLQSLPPGGICCLIFFLGLPFFETLHYVQVVRKYKAQAVRFKWGTKYSEHHLERKIANLILSKFFRRTPKKPIFWHRCTLKWKCWKPTKSHHLLV